ncbi:5-methylcytosine-specific restriction endonuclease system specificity protein McrC [Roseibacillus persicicus]|uniref:Protein McrC n=1 Tax=Roseibacillus persicicus TaxID=454148 RepID=A0A918WQK5_9BACT|nr:5-methylcytosine-specific restriction endonuclease system specificity protein McrC [Roseibacillus persicicus]GHC66908.1 protein McrC [Roseibacillus persicicus]
MPQDIPIQNVYYLLCYAWDKLDVAGTIDVSAEDSQTLDDLFARVLINGTDYLVRHGFDRDYILEREKTPKLRGRIDVGASMQRQTWRQGRMVCEFDEFSYNVLHNRILRTTIEQMLRCSRLDHKLADQLKQKLQLMGEIESIVLTKPLFRRVRIHRNNRQYRFLMSVCELIYDSLLPTENQGESRFQNFLREEKAMAALFEKFVKTFYSRHSDFEVSAPHLHWSQDGPRESLDLIPRMETDVALESAERQIVLDCKFYKEAFKAKGTASARFNSNHLYQITAYLRNAEREKGWSNVEGILLYPAVAQNFRHDLQLDGYRLQIASIDLDQDWTEIHHGLITLLEA